MTDSRVAEGRKLKEDFLKYAEHKDADWDLVKEALDFGISICLQSGVKVYRQKNGEVFKCEVMLDASKDRVIQLTSPAGGLRIKWDQFLEDLIVEETIEKDSIMLVYHATKPTLGGMVSPRDSIDLVSIGWSDQVNHVAALGTTHENYPEKSGYVRVMQQPSGYLMFSVEGQPDKCRFVMIFDADLRMNALLNFGAKMLKPSLMIEKMQNLQKAIADNLQ